MSCFEIGTWMKRTNVWIPGQWGREGGGMNWEIRIDIYIYYHV